VRSHNEDAWVCEPERGLFAVIDGMGGQQAGEIAADLVRRSLLGPAAPLRAIQGANRSIIERGQRDERLKGMGCVVTAARLRASQLELFHVGDTRAYLASDAGCEQLTRDHTAAAEAQEKLGLTEAQAQNLAGHHKVTRDVGRRFQPDERWIDLSEVEFAPGDLLLICSDGLHDLVPHRELVGLLAAARREQEPLGALCDRLVELALARGGRDNTTVLAVRRLASPVPEQGPRRGRSLVFILAALAIGLLVGVAVGGSLGWLRKGNGGGGEENPASSVSGSEAAGQDATIPRQAGSADSGEGSSGEIMSSTQPDRSDPQPEAPSDPGDVQAPPPQPAPETVSPQGAAP